MKRPLLILILVTLSLVIIVAINSKTSSKTIDPYELINSNLIEVQNFAVSAQSKNLNSSAKGTFFLEEFKDSKYKMKISSNIEVDQNDWGGVSFTIPNGWEISNIQSSYGGNNKNLPTLHENASIWISEGNDKWKYMIDFGRDIIHQVSNGGGEGTVIIELHSTKEFTKENSLNFIIAVGSDSERGVGGIVGTDSVNVSFSIDAN